MAKRRRRDLPGWVVLVMASAVFLQSCGGSGSSGGGGGQLATPPSVPTSLTAAAGNLQVSLTWSASTGATRYNVKRATATGGPYTQVANTTVTNDTDASLTNGTTYYYVVSAVNSAGESANSTQVSATPVAPFTAVNVTVDVLANRHTISPYVYGGSYPASAAAVTDSGLSVVRWGGNATSTYNWQLFTYNADNDYYFEDFAYSELGDSDSVQFVKDVEAAKSVPLMTMVMLPWVAQSAENGSNGHWSFSRGTYPSQCSFDQYNTDAGDGLQTDCKTPINTLPVTTAYFPLLDDHTQTCTAGANCVYRNDWAQALAAAFGGSVSHFYDMDNEIDIWGGTHFDIHPLQSGYGELRDTYLSEARALKTWDPAAIRFGPVSCCWYFYWDLNSSTDNKSTHAGMDFLPWWLNEVTWSDATAGARSLDVFDIHAYPDGPDTTNFTQAQKQALTARIYRDWWDPTYTSEAAYIATGGFSIEPVDSKPFRIPRMRALVNQIYPGTQFSITEWSAAFAGESDFSTALGDADAYGILGRERAYVASRWTAPVVANPNYQGLKLFTNYDAAHHGFGTTSVSATHDADPNLLSTYAALNSTGTTLTVVVLNKDPGNAAQVQFATTGFTPSNVTTYTLSQSSPTNIVASSVQSWSSTLSFAPYTATLLVVSGSMTSTPASEWDLNPDTVMVPASGTVTLQPKITSGAANVTLSSAAFDSFGGASACGGTITLPTPTITPTLPGEITVTAGSTSGFCHFTVTGTDGTVTQTQGGWIVVGKPAATLVKTSGDGQTASAGSTLPQALTVTLSPGQSGGSSTGASILFTASAGSLSNGTSSGPKVIAVTNSSGVASVTLTLPSTAEAVTVTAAGPYGLGHPVAPTFTETSQ
jgi:glycosyl hydrolase family 44